jgi:hypothetical protein
MTWQYVLSAEEQCRVQCEEPPGVHAGAPGRRKLTPDDEQIMKTYKYNVIFE